MKKIGCWFLGLSLYTSAYGMDTVYSSVKNIIKTIDQRITKLVRQHGSKKKLIAYKKKITNLFEQTNNPIQLYNSLRQYEVWYHNLKQVEYIKRRLRDLQYTIYIQQAVVAGLKDVARNQYVLEHKINNMVLLTPGNSNMYYPIKEAAQHALHTAYEHADHMSKTESKSWFQAVESVQTHVEHILVENQEYKKYLEKELKKHSVKVV